MILQPSPSLKEYHTTPSNKKYGIDNLPGDDLRLYDEEIKSQEEYLRESQISEQHVSTKPSTQHSSKSGAHDEEEFNFENSRSEKEKPLNNPQDDHSSMRNE